MDTDHQQKWCDADAEQFESLFRGKRMKDSFHGEG